jgi:UDP-N-acetylmuramate-alanine ligase
MSQLNLEDVKKIYFVGIGGIAMSAVAGIAKEHRFEVTGSDSQNIYAPAKDVLEDLDIEYFVGYDAEHIKQSHAELFILSAGETQANPEVEYIIKHDLQRASFAELLRALYDDKLRVVVAGTHGKSTTTGLLGHTLKNLDGSSYMTGAVLQHDNLNFYVGDGNYSVFEGDE